MQFPEIYDQVKDSFHNFLKENLVNGGPCRLCRTKDVYPTGNLSFLT